MSQRNLDFRPQISIHIWKVSTWSMVWRGEQLDSKHCQRAFDAEVLVRVLRVKTADDILRIYKIRCVEGEKLEKKGAWDSDSVVEWSEISGKARSAGTKLHVGNVFEICVEEGSELDEGNPLRKFKGRTVFQGNKVTDESSEVARLRSC